MTPAQLDALFHDLPDSYPTYRACLTALIARYNERLEQFPPHYQFDDLVAWLLSSGQLRGDAMHGYRLTIREASA